MDPNENRGHLKYCVSYCNKNNSFSTGRCMTGEGKKLSYPETKLIKCWQERSDPMQKRLHCACGCRSQRCFAGFKLNLSAHCKRENPIVIGESLPLHRGVKCDFITDRLWYMEQNSRISTEIYIGVAPSLEMVGRSLGKVVSST